MLFSFCGFRSVATQILALTEGLRGFYQRENTFLVPEDNDSHMSTAEDEKRAKGKTHAETGRSTPSVGKFFSAERPPHLKLREGGAVKLHYNDIQPQFIQALSNGLWIANPPHRGGSSPLITPPIPTHTHYNRPNKGRGEWASALSAARTLNSGLQRKKKCVGVTNNVLKCFVI